MGKGKRFGPLFINLNEEKALPEKGEISVKILCYFSERNTCMMIIINNFIKRMSTFLLIIFIIINCTEANQKVLSEKKFTEVYLDSLKKRHPLDKYVIEKNLEIHNKSDDKDFIHFLDNAYTAYKNSPDSLSSVISMYLKSADEIYGPEKPIQISKIVPVIKDAGYVDEIPLSLGQNNKDKKPVELVYEMYNDKLLILYGEDTENGISYFTREKFEETGLNKDSLLPLAIRNLNEILPAINRNGEKGLYMITAGGNYEASLILLTDIWSKENMPVNGQIVIAIPTRDLLFVTGSKNAEDIKKLKEYAKEAWSTGPYQLLPDLFIWDGEKFEPYK